MARLNKKNEKTEKVIHLLVTNLCDRSCMYCCNKQYDINKIPYVTDQELRNARVLCLTGGEPFKYAQPNEIAKYYKGRYPNINKVYVYTNAYEFNKYWLSGNFIDYIDGINVSIKSGVDIIAFDFIKERMRNYPRSKEMSNRLYVFDDLYRGNAENFLIISRKWQEDFEPATDSIFRRI